MSNEAAAELMIICGCLLELAENSKDIISAQSIVRVEERLEGILDKYFTEIK